MASNLTIDALLALGVERLSGARGAGQPRDLRMVGRANSYEAPAPHAPADHDAAASHDAPAFALDAELLLAHVLGKTRTYLKAHPEQAASHEQAAQYTALLDRRAVGEPIAYIVGHKDFWTFTLGVNPSVLVPRPETELLVERALALGPAGSAAVVDLGTGSGAIALALASERSQWQVTAVDLSADALATARANAASLDLERVEFLNGRWFAPLRNRRFHLIASNPPYVSEHDDALKTLQHEPQMALASGPEGLDAIREIVQAAPEYLERHGWLILEHGSDQAAAVAHELVGRGFAHVRSHRDLAGHWRLTEAQWDHGDPPPP